MKMRTGKTRTLALVALLAGGLGLAGCQSTNQTVGAGAGGLLGGLLGSQFGGGTGNLIATGIGVGVGALVGQQVGAYLDERDREMAQQSTVQTYRTGSSQSWNNPKTGATGTVRPVGTTTTVAGGDSCQLQEQTIRLEDGTADTTRYRICKRGDQFYTEPA